MKGEIIIEATRGALMPAPNEIDPEREKWDFNAVSVWRATFPNGDVRGLCHKFDNEDQAIRILSACAEGYEVTIRYHETPFFLHFF